MFSSIYRSSISAFFLGIIAIATVNAQESEKPVHISINQDVAANFTGGIQAGVAHTGLINLNFAMNTEQMNLWDNGTFRFHIQNTYGQKPSQDLVGDIQVFSNIEHGNYTYLFQFWYKHQMGDFSLLLGKHDLNKSFFASDLAGAYINSSFGIMPLAPLNVPVSIFPNTTLGMVGKYEINKNLALQGGLYNGKPGKITHSNFGTDLNLKKDNGLFYIGEFHLENLFMGKTGTYKIGGYHHSGKFQHPVNNQSVQRGGSGMYFIADQMIYSEKQNNKEGLATLLQLGYSPGNHALNDFYAAYGLNYSGLFSSSSTDQLGLAVAHASVNNKLHTIDDGNYKSCETVFELTYKYPLPWNLVIQPDFQYIIHPGMKSTFSNAFVGLFRIHWQY
jgi:porin